MVRALPICIGCAHFDQSEPAAMRCSAFPQGIPLDIAEGKVVHRKGYEGDHGLRYEPRRVRNESNIMVLKANEYDTSRRYAYSDWSIEEEAS